MPGYDATPPVRSRACTAARACRWYASARAPPLGQFAVEAARWARRLTAASAWRAPSLRRGIGLPIAPVESDQRPAPGACSDRCALGIEPEHMGELRRADRALGDAARRGGRGRGSIPPPLPRAATTWLTTDASTPVGVLHAPPALRRASRWSSPWRPMSLQAHRRQSNRWRRGQVRGARRAGSTGGEDRSPVNCRPSGARRRRWARAARRSVRTMHRSRRASLGTRPVREQRLSVDGAALVEQRHPAPR